LRLACLILVVSAAAQTVNVDQSRSGANQSETTLTIAAVMARSFGTLGRFYANGDTIFAQPLKANGVVVGGKTYNLLIIPTVQNSVYAFNADAPGSAPLWSNLNFALPYVSHPGVAGSLYGPIGCMSTPVVDAANGKLYVACATSTPTWVLRQLDLATGATLISTTITATVTGTGDAGGSGAVGGGAPAGPADNTAGGNLTFYPNYELNRAGLTLANSKVYVAFAGIEDRRPYHGWVISFNISDLSQSAAWCSTPNGWGGGIWMSGGGIATDSGVTQFLYLTTGNGTAYDGTSSFTNCAIRLAATLALSDWFAPSDNVSIDSVDADLSSGRGLLFPGSGGQMVVAGKDFTVYVIEQTCMGHLQNSSDCGLQTFQTDSVDNPSSSSGSYGGVYSTALNELFLPITTGTIYAYSWNGSSFNTTPVFTRAVSYASPGPAAMSLSSNGASDAILWFTTVASSSFLRKSAGTLHAVKASDGSEIFSDSGLGNMAKFAAPLVQDGKVFVATADGTVVVYGLAVTSTGGLSMSGSVSVAGSVVAGK
jgi:hypothetical protein